MAGFYVKKVHLYMQHIYTVFVNACMLMLWHMKTSSLSFNSACFHVSE